MATVKEQQSLTSSPTVFTVLDPLLLQYSSHGISGCSVQRAIGLGNCEMTITTDIRVVRLIADRYV